MSQPVFWLTGLPGAGKTTLAKALVQKFLEAGVQVIHLDGDSLRQVFQDDDYSEAGRRRLAMQYGRLCQMLSKQQIPVIISTVSLFHQVQRWNRSNITHYVEVFLATPREILHQRDQKNLYSHQEPAAIAQTVGRGIVPELPEQPNFLLQLKDMHELEDAAEQLWQRYLQRFAEVKL